MRPPIQTVSWQADTGLSSRPQAEVTHEASRGTGPKAFDRRRKHRDRGIVPDLKGYGCTGKRPKLSDLALAISVLPQTAGQVAFCGWDGCSAMLSGGISCLVGGTLW